MNVRRGRFAPTPSGYMHLGNAMTALLVWLQMRKCGGTVILRIEDLDAARAKPAYAKQLLADLRWLGIDWDEGPSIGGPHEPYEQSLRQTLYEQALAALRTKGLLYPCFCSRADLLALAQAPHSLQAEGHSYPGHCKTLTARERADRSRGKSPSWRFSLPPTATSWHDLAALDCTYSAGYGGDFIVLRADGVVSYQLAVVVDDYAMGITDVLRGRDLLESTTRQLVLYNALDFTPPTFTHAPLVLSASGQRLAKRDHALTLASLRANGTSAQAVLGCLAQISGLRDQFEPVRAEELIADFSEVKLTPDAWQLTTSDLGHLLA